MSHTNRNFVVAYILLVGLPLLGLAGVLKTGRGLVAPISVDGVWKIEADASRTGSQPCAKGVFSLASSLVVISQSGKSLVLTFSGNSKSVASGTLEGRTLTASIVPIPDSANDAGCSGDASLTLTATVDPKAEPRSLAGTLSVDGCSSCVTVEFKAVRQQRAAGGGAH